MPDEVGSSYMHTAYFMIFHNEPIISTGGVNGRSLNISTPNEHTVVWFYSNMLLV